VPRFTAPETYTPRHLAEKILTSKSALEGKRKQVMVLFADLKGSLGCPARSASACGKGGAGDRSCRRYASLQSRRHTLSAGKTRLAVAVIVATVALISMAAAAARGTRCQTDGEESQQNGLYEPPCVPVGHCAPPLAAQAKEIRLPTPGTTMPAALIASQVIPLVKFLNSTGARHCGMGSSAGGGSVREVRSR
jgi:hypothetical protein